MEKTFPFLTKLALVLFCIISIGYLLILGHSILSPMFFAFLMALLLLPLATFLENKWHFKRSLSTITAVILMILVLSGVIFFFSNQIRSFADDWPQLKQQGLSAFHTTQEWVASKMHINVKKQMDYINQGAEKLFSTSTVILGGTLATVSSSFIFMSFTLLFTFFILNYRRVLYTFLVTVFRKDDRHHVEYVIEKVKSIIKKYIIGLLMQMLIVSVLLIIILSIIGVKYAILLGFMGGIFNVIPYLGIILALLLSCLVTFATVGGSKVLIVIVTFIIVHLIDSNVIMPLVVGSKVKLNPMIAFIGVVVGEMLWGISGMFLCIPFMAILKIIFDRINGLQPWGILMGEEGELKKTKRSLLMVRKK